MQESVCIHLPQNKSRSVFPVGPQSGQPEHSTLVKARYISIVLKANRVQETARKISTLAHSVSFFWASFFSLILPSFSKVDATYSLNYYKYSHSDLSTSGVCLHSSSVNSWLPCASLSSMFLFINFIKKCFKTTCSNSPPPWFTHYTSFFQRPHCCMCQHCLSDLWSLQFCRFIRAGKKSLDSASLLHVNFFSASSLFCTGRQHSSLSWISVSPCVNRCLFHGTHEY